MSDKPTHEIDGDKQWLKDGNFHRENGPAIENADGTKQWYLHGKRHREDGPAVEWVYGAKEWWLHDKRVHPETLVDLHLSRGVFCYYDEEANELRFDA
tara:strand:+ start:402 stop:695 length:294 start_codon:yes stop_codon:yes gene_type:complete